MLTEMSKQNKIQNKSKKNSSRAGFEPTRGNPIGFQVQRLDRSAIVTANS